MSLRWNVRLSYAVGHVLNDLCSSVWFTYTLVYFKFGVDIPTTLAGSLVLIGQVADGLATPLVGYFSDRGFSLAEESSYEPIPGIENSPSSRVLRRLTSWLPSGRKAWHFWGSFLVVVSFPLIFGSPVASTDANIWAKMIYYSLMIIFFQIGWAAVQITHLALMNDLTRDPGERTLLASFRYLFTVLSNLAVYLCTFFLLHHSDSDPSPHNATLVDQTSLRRHRHLSSLVHRELSDCNNSDDIGKDIDFGKDDLPAFRNLSLTIIAVGGFMTVLFHIGLRHMGNLNRIESNSSSPTEQTPLTDSNAEHLSSAVTSQVRIYSWKGWLKLPMFWIHGLVYMTVRVIVNVSQAYITVYLLHSLLLPKKTITLVPLTMYLTSMLTLVVQKPIQDRISRELNAFFGMLFVTCFCIMANHPGNPVRLWLVYTAAGFLGVGCTIILITALAMVSDLIGSNHSNGAFVYGYMSFTDKLANGLVIQLVETFWNRFPCPWYYQNVESYGIGGWVAVGCLFLLIQTILKYSRQSRPQASIASTPAA